MKVKTKDAPKATHYLPLDRIVDLADLGKVKVEADHVEALQASIERDGLDTPLIVWNGGEDYPTMTLKNGDEVPSSFMIAGAHRRAALRRIAKDSADRYAELFPNGVPVVLATYKSVAEALAARLRENLARRVPSMDELLPYMVRLRDEFKMKQKHIAAAIGKSEAFVTQVFAVEEELGEEGTKAVVEGEVAAKDAIKAAKEIKEARKAGKPVDKKAAVAKAKAATASRKSAGRERDEKRPSLKRLWKRFKALPSLRVGEKLDILEGMIVFAIGETDKLPKELRKATEEKSKTEKE